MTGCKSLSSRWLHWLGIVQDTGVSTRRLATCNLLQGHRGDSTLDIGLSRQLESSFHNTRIRPKDARTRYFSAEIVFMARFGNEDADLDA